MEHFEGDGSPSTLKSQVATGSTRWEANVRCFDNSFTCFSILEFANLRSTRLDIRSDETVNTSARYAGLDVYGLYGINGGKLHVQNSND
ncbi:hypothetical protein AKJ16_DCAP13701 [Drosera capensis]